MGWLADRLQETVQAWERRGWVSRPRPLHKHVVRGVKDGVRESVAFPPGGGGGHWYYGSSKIIRDLTPRQHYDLIGMAEFLAANDAVASRLLDIRTSLVCGNGWDPVATSEDPEARDAVQKHLDRIWEFLGWEDRRFQRVRDLAVTGELIHWRPPPNRAEGYWEPGTILPHNVERVYQHPMNADCLTRLKLFEQGLEWWEWEDGQRVRHDQDEFEIVRRERFGDQQGRVVGEVFFLGVNRFPGGTRGLSDLLPLREWIEMYGQALYTAMQRLQAQASYLYHVTLSDAQEDQILFRAEQIRKSPPKPGEVLITSEAENWNVMTPDLNAGDSDVLMDRIFKQILGAAGIPIHWWTDGGDVNRATAQEMDTPVFATVRNRKHEIGCFIDLQVAYALQDVADAGALVDRNGRQVPRGEMGFELQPRDPDQTEYDVAGTALQALGQAMAVATTTGLLGDREAAQVYRAAVTALLNFELPEPDVEDGEAPESELERAEREVADELERARAEMARRRVEDGEAA